MAYISNEQRKRDKSGKKEICACCGYVSTPLNKLVLSTSGSRVHKSHITDPTSGFYGKAQK